MEYKIHSPLRVLNNRPNVPFVGLVNLRRLRDGKWLVTRLDGARQVVPLPGYQVSYFGLGTVGSTYNEEYRLIL